MRKALSSSTQNILSLVTDPYHDFNLQPTGYPDGKSLASCVQRFNGRVTLSCPFILTAGDTWEVLVYTTGLHYIINMRGASFENSIIGTDAALNQVGPIIILYTHRAANGTIKAISRFALGPPSVSSAGRHLDRTRTVSLGFEIHNVTPELYKGGSISVFRTNAIENTFDGRRGESPTIQSFSGTYVCQTPIDDSCISSMPNVRTWESAEGCYCVALPAVNNPFGDPSGGNMLMTESFNFGGELKQTCLVFPLTTQYTPTIYTSSSLLHNVGALTSRFTTTNDVFTLDYRLILETETTGFSPLNSFALKPPAVDRTFLKLYEAMIPNIPAGVPVGFNDAGEWFRRIMKIANTALPLIMPFLPPQAKMVAAIASPIVSTVSESLNKRAKKKKMLKSGAGTSKTSRMLPANKQ